MKIYKDMEQGSESWFKCRAWVLTWTRLKNIMAWKDLKDWWLSATTKKAMLNCMYELIGWEFSFDENAPEISTYLMNMWNELEWIAKAKYSNHIWKEIKEVWFIKKNDWLWLSPDGLIESWSDEYKESIEIKCPLWNNSKNFFKYMFEDKIPDEYLWQVVHNFIVIWTLERLHFVVYNPNLPKEKQLWIKIITKEELKEDIEKAENRIIEFRKIWEEHLKILIK